MDSPNLNQEYLNHKVFNNLDKLIEFYDDLAFHVISWADTGIKGNMITHNTYVFSSIKGTLESIKIVLNNGRINDAFALLRKLYDAVLTNTYINLIMEAKNPFKHFDKIRSFDDMFVQEIDEWVKSKRKLPSSKQILSYIEKSPLLSHILPLIHTDKRYKNIKDRCNDHMHFNYFFHMFSNDNQVNNSKRLNMLETLNKDLIDVFILHFAFIFTIKDVFMMSGDYVDHLECGMEPPEDCQYWVAPFIKDIFKELIMSYRSDIGTEMIKNSQFQLKD
jgi:hypothetical protein